jgi:glycosyltransferase involved in cell wall biosynthesis
VGATVAAARGLPGVDVVVVVDDGSSDDTAGAAARAGARVVSHARNRGKSAAMKTGALAVDLLESEDGSGPRHLLFLDADLGVSAAGAGPLAEPVRSGAADMTIAVFRDTVRLGGFGVVTGVAGAGIERATGWRPAQPLNGQRCLTRPAFAAALPLAPGWGVETGMTIDLIRRGLRIAEVEVPLAHRATGTDWRSQLHRLSQLRDVSWALIRRCGLRRRPGNAIMKW